MLNNQMFTLKKLNIDLKHTLCMIFYEHIFKNKLFHTPIYFLVSYFLFLFIQPHPPPRQRKMVPCWPTCRCLHMRALSMTQQRGIRMSSVLSQRQKINSCLMPNTSACMMLIPANFRRQCSTWECHICPLGNQPHTRL